METDNTTSKGSVFWGHECHINAVDHAEEGLTNLLEDEENSGSTHMVYAYICTDADGKVTESHSDDGEIRSSNILCNELKKSGVNALVVVFQNYGGKNLGHQWLEIYRQQTQALIKKLGGKGEERTGQVTNGTG